MTNLSLHRSPLPAETFLSEMTASMSAYFLGSHGQNTWEATSPRYSVKSLCEAKVDYIHYSSGIQELCDIRAPFLNPCCALLNIALSVIYMCHDLVSSSPSYQRHTPIVRRTFFLWRVEPLCSLHCSGRVPLAAECWKNCVSGVTNYCHSPCWACGCIVPAWRPVYV